MNEGQRVAAKPVTDGRRVRWTLEQVRSNGGGLVRLDWLRFTLPLEAVVSMDPALPSDLSYLDLMDRESRDTVRRCRGTSRFLDETNAMSVARSCATRLLDLLGSFELGTVEDKGMDYYEARCPILYESQVVGFVLAGGKSSNQAATVHINLFGSACLHIAPAQWANVRDWLASYGGHITRVDLACDVFEGDDITAVPTAWKSGEFDVMGKRPSETVHGSWFGGHSRTFEVGKRQTGKCMRAYEKGDEQFGPEENDPWIRYEVEIRNSSRVIDLDVLTRPADFFAGAYPFCESLLERLGQAATAQKVKTCTRLADATAEAAATRGVKWFVRTAAPMFCRLLLDGGELLEVVADRESHRRPGRFAGFTRSAMADALRKVGEALAPAPSPSFIGA